MLISLADAMSVMEMPLFDELNPRCFECGDIGITVSSEGEVRECWRVKAGVDHNAPTPAAVVLARTLQKLVAEGIRPEAHAFHVARSLTRYSSAEPCRRERLTDAHFGYSKDPVRQLHKVVETLRSVWRLPVGARKEDPAGYWIITELDDFADWVRRAKSAPIAQLTTIHRVARANFPVFAEQLELEFWNDIEGGAR